MVSHFFHIECIITASVFKNFGTIGNFLKKAFPQIKFDHEMSFYLNHTLVGLLVYFLLNFKIGQGLLVHPVHLTSPNSQFISFSILICVIFFSLKSMDKNPIFISLQQNTVSFLMALV